LSQSLQIPHSGTTRAMHAAAKRAEKHEFSQTALKNQLKDA
jgi:hypothetical protein